MSKHDSLEFDFEESFDTLKIIDNLLSGGWSYNDSGKIVYLPLGDKGLFDWKSKALESWGNVYDVIREKVRCGEVVGLNMTWQDSGVGAQFLFDSGNKVLAVNLTINRIRASDSNDTDFSWYIPRIINSLEKDGYKMRVHKE